MTVLERLPAVEQVRHLAFAVRQQLALLEKELKRIQGILKELDGEN